MGKPYTPDDRSESRWVPKPGKTHRAIAIDLPEELKGLEKGRYVLLPVDEAPDLTEEQEAGLEAALASVRAGKGASLEQVRAKLKPHLW